MKARPDAVTFSVRPSNREGIWRGVMGAVAGPGSRRNRKGRAEEASETAPSLDFSASLSRTPGELACLRTRGLWTAGWGIPPG